MGTGTSQRRAMAKQECDANQRVYDKQLRNTLERTHSGQFALMSAGKVIDIYDIELEAVLAGHQKFGTAKYSIVEINREPLYVPTILSVAD